MKSTSSGTASGFGRRSRRGRFPLAGVAGVLIAVGIAAALLVQALNDRFNARAAFPLVEGRITVAGINEPIEIYVNNRLVARGEVVVIEDRLGVTMTEIIQKNTS